MSKRAGAGPSLPLVFFLVTAAALALGSAAVLFSESPPAEHTVSNRPIERPEDGYVSSQACRACHPDHYHSWSASYHRTMTQLATPATARARFDDVTVEGVHGRPMRLARRGAQLWAEFDDPDSSQPPEQRPRIERQVVMITGSHHQQIYWYATGRNRLLGQLPGAYLISEQEWIPRRSAVLHPPADATFSETGHWNSTCIACHATHGKTAFDTPFGSQPIETQVVDTTVGELGIACEACHGPGDAHVRAHRNPLRRYTRHLSEGRDATIVQPSRLDAQLSSQTCGQCHGIWEFYDQAGERRANSEGLPFRPGDQLLKTRFVAQPTVNGDSPTMKALLSGDAGFVQDSFWPDGKVRVSGREYNGLLESPCFKQAPSTQPERTLSCFSCHTMHKPAADPRPFREWTDDQLGAGMDGNAACLQCHPSYRSNLSKHTRHAPESVGSSCYNCHMPYTTYGLLKTIRSHTISSPSVKESMETGRPNACNLCHLDKTLAWTSGALGDWYDQPAIALTVDERSIAASLLWLLRGDAGQRAIVAQAMAWGPAQRTSGADWMAPHLATLLDDPYDAVRFIGGRSLRSLPGLHGASYEFTAPPERRRESQLRTMVTWDRARPRPLRTDNHLLLAADGSVAVDSVLHLLKERNNRRVFLRE